MLDAACDLLSMDLRPVPPQPNCPQSMKIYEDHRFVTINQSSLSKLSSVHENICRSHMLQLTIPLQINGSQSIKIYADHMCLTINYFSLNKRMKIYMHITCVINVSQSIKIYADHMCLTINHSPLNKRSIVHKNICRSHVSYYQPFPSK